MVKPHIKVFIQEEYFSSIETIVTVTNHVYGISNGDNNSIIIHQSCYEETIKVLEIRKLVTKIEFGIENNRVPAYYPKNFYSNEAMSLSSITKITDAYEECMMTDERTLFSSLKKRDQVDIKLVHSLLLSDN